MIESSRTLYKLMVLYMQKSAAFPLTAAQISDYISGNGYTSYFRLQEILQEMLDTGLLTKKNGEHMSYYEASEKGLETLRYLSSEISQEIRDEIRTYLEMHARSMRRGTETKARYLHADGGYRVELTASEDEIELIRLSLFAPTETAAQNICDAWKDKHADVYAAVMNLMS